MDKPEKDNSRKFSGDFNIRSQWVVIADTENRTVAEFAVNGLKSYDIPAVLDARPGVLGSAGLSMRSLRTGELETFKILVPLEYEEEASDIVKIFIGDGKTENDDDDNRPPDKE